MHRGAGRPLGGRGRPSTPRARGRSRSRRGATRSARGGTTPRSRSTPASTSSSMLEEGARLYERAADRRCPKAAARRSLSGACTRPARRRPAAARPARRRRSSPTSSRSLDRAPGARAGHRARERTRSGSTGERALYGAWYEFFPRSRGRASTRPPSPARSAPPPSGCRRSPRWASTSSTCRRSTRSARSTARAPTTPSTPGPRRPGQPVGHRLRRGRPRRRPPRPRHPRRLRRLRRARPRELGMEVALDFALQCSPDHPWVNGAPGVVHHPRRRHDRLRREPAEEVPGHLPAQLRQRPARACTPRSLRVVEHWIDHGVRIFRVDNPHTKPLAFWEWLIAEVKQTDPDVLFLAEAFTRPAMMHELAEVGFTQSLHLLHLAHRKRRAAGVPRGARRRPTPTTCGQLLRQHARHPARVPAVRRPAGVQDPRRARRAAVADYGVYSGYELCEHVAVRPGSEEYLDSREVPATAARLGRRARSLAPYLTHAQRIRRAHPALHRLRNLALPPRRQRRRSSALEASGPATTSCSSSSTSTRTASREATRARSTCRRSGFDWDDRVRGARRADRRRRGPGASATTSGSTRRRAGARLHRAARPAVTPGRRMTRRVARQPRGVARPAAGTSAPSSTRCSSAASPTPTATAPATSAA